MNVNRSPLIEALERRALCAAVGSISGNIVYQYPLSTGGTAQTPLAGRFVYDDVQDTGKLAAGDPVAVTDLDGRYTLGLVGASQTVRVVDRPGWSMVGGGSLVASPGDAVAPLIMTMTRPVVVDVVAAYTSDATSSYAPGDDDPTGVLAGVFEYANRVQADSDTNVRINLVSSVLTTGKVTGDLNKDLDRLQAGALTDVAAARRSSGADLTMLFEPDHSDTAANDGEIGVAYEFQRDPGSVNYSQGVVSLLGDTDTDGQTLAHELGHLLGADHDPANAKDSTAAPFARGYKFIGGDGNPYQDVMSYGSGTVLPYYSTPTAFYGGHVLGKSNADNARAVRSAAAYVARYDTTGDEGPAAALVSATLIQRLSVPASNHPMIGGARGSAVVNLTDVGPGAVDGLATITLALTSDSDPAAAAIALSTSSTAVRFGLAQSHSLIPRFTWPTNLAAGSYRVVATVTAAGATAEATGGSALSTSAAITYLPPTVDLSATATPARGKPGRSTAIRLRLHDAGNSPGVGTVALTATLTASDGTVTTVPVPVFRVKVPAGGNQVVSVSVAVPDLSTGQYAFAMTIIPATTVDDVDPSDKALSTVLLVV